MNYLSKAYEVNTTTTSTNQDLSANCRRVRIHVASQPVFMAVGSVLQTVGGVPAEAVALVTAAATGTCLLYTSPSPRDQRGSRMPSSA